MYAPSAQVSREYGVQLLDKLAPVTVADLWLATGYKWMVSVDDIAEGTIPLKCRLHRVCRRRPDERIRRRKWG